jgi:Sec23/Sec24 trunk domain/Sec23/Sec24 zinc finger
MHLQVLQQRPFFNSTDLPTGFLFAPLATPLGLVPWTQAPPPQCSHCGGYASKFTEYTYASSSWRCNFCGAEIRDNRDEPLQPDAVYEQQADYDCIPTSDAAALSAASAWPTMVMLIIDASLDEDLLADVVAATKALLQALPPATHIALITLSSCVSVAELGTSQQGAGACAQCTVLPGTEVPTERMIAQLRSCSSGAVAPVADCMAQARAVLDSLRPHHHAQPSRERPRCLGAALQAALLLHAAHKASDAMSAAAQGQARVVAMLGGPVTVGPGCVPLASLDGVGTAGDEFARGEANKFVNGLAERMADAGVHMEQMIGTDDLCYLISCLSLAMKFSWQPCVVDCA